MAAVERCRALIGWDLGVKQLTGLVRPHHRFRQVCFGIGGAASLTPHPLIHVTHSGPCASPSPSQSWQCVLLPRCSLGTVKAQSTFKLTAMRLQMLMWCWCVEGVGDGGFLASAVARHFQGRHVSGAQSLRSDWTLRQGKSEKA